MPPKKGKKGGKKGKKSGKKKKEESPDKKALANQKVWQARLRCMELTKDDYRDNARHMATQNDYLQSQMRQVEMDTIDVISFLKTQDQKKDAVVDKLEEELKKIIAHQEQERKTLVTDYTDQIRSIETQISKKQDDIVLMQNELKHVKEFRKKRVAMQRELDEIKDVMFTADREHKQEVARMTQKFEDEKVAMQKDTNNKISALADHAHQQAITNLDETTRSVYKENVRLTEALRFHNQETDRLATENQELEKHNEELELEAEDRESLVQERVAAGHSQRQQLQDVDEKIEALERVLNDTVSRFKKEQKNIGKYSTIESQSSEVEIAKLERLLQLKTVECAKVRKMARNILMQRTDIETHFLDSLESVREDFSIASGLPSRKVMVSDLPWEYRELVLRALFARMNASASKMTKKLPTVTERTEQPVAINDGDLDFLLNQDDVDKDLTFLTGGNLTDVDSEAKPVTEVQ